jgi:hypothetical protein
VEKGGPSLVARRRARSSDDLDDDSSDNAVFAIKNAGHAARPKRPPVSEQQRSVERPDRSRKPPGSVAGVEWKEELDLEKVRLKGECTL